MSSPATKTTRASETRRSVPKTRSSSVSVSAEQRRQMIEEAAYFRAERRSSLGGDPVADWLSSEREVDTLLSQSAH